MKKTCHACNGSGRVFACNPDGALDHSTCHTCNGSGVTVPTDYEVCSECGFDHSYEPDEAYSAHLDSDPETDPRGVVL